MIAFGSRILQTVLTVIVLHCALGATVEAQARDSLHMGGMAMDRVIRTYVLVEQLEIHANAAERPLDFELMTWMGGDYRRLVLRAQGEQSTRIFSGGELQGDVLVARLITPFWSAVAGVRIDTRPRVRALSSADNVLGISQVPDSRYTRGMVAVGLIGLAPGWFEFEPTLFVSDKGHVSAELQTAFDLLLTQRLIVQPWVEIDAAVQAVPDIAVASGFNDVEVGARLRYEMRRKFAPYVGVSWLRRSGGTSGIATVRGQPRGSGIFEAGVRMWR